MVGRRPGARGRRDGGLPIMNAQMGMTTSQAAEYVGVSLSTIRRWADAGHVQCYRTPGGQRRFSKDQLDAFIATLLPREEAQ